MRTLILSAASLMLVVACAVEGDQTAESKDAKVVQMQQAQYAKAQPIPVYDYSLERDLLIQLYNIRNQEVATHSVWRSDYGQIEGDCPSMGYGLPYDTSLTNPWLATDIDSEGEEHHYQGGALVAVGQPEPNGIYASTNTAATWVMCVGPGGVIEPMYIETKVTVYPGPVEVDYVANQVWRDGQASVTVKVGR